jgi:hypothetical protein
VEGRNKANTIETLLVTVILIILTAAVFALIAAGGGTYKKILDGKDSASRARTALSYAAVKIRQNDTAGMISVSNDAIPGISALVIRHTGDLAGMITYIFFEDGTLWESFIQDTQKPGMDNAMKICRVDNFTVSEKNEGKMIYIESSYGRNGSEETLKSTIYLRTESREGKLDED